MAKGASPGACRQIAYVEFGAPEARRVGFGNIG